MKSLTQHFLALVVLAAGLFAAPLGNRDSDTVPAQIQEPEYLKERRGGDIATVENAKDDEEWVAPEGVNTVYYVM